MSDQWSTGINLAIGAIVSGAIVLAIRSFRRLSTMLMARDKLLSKGWDGWLDEVETHIIAAKDYTKLLVRLFRGTRYTDSSWKTATQDIVERYERLDTLAIPDNRLHSAVFWIDRALEDVVSKVNRAMDEGVVNSKLREEILDLRDGIAKYYALAEERILTLRKRAYCKKCKKMVDIKNLQTVTIGDGRRKGQGVCSKCGTAVHRFYSV